MKEKAVRARLSALMFLHYFVLGCTIPIMSLYLKQYLGFSGTRTGIIMAMSAGAGFVGPFIGGFVADRYISAERLFALSHLLGGCLIIGIYFFSGFVPVLFLYLFYMLFIGPCTSLSNAITFHHIPDGKKHYGGIRIWGTIGWIVVGWLFSYLWLRDGSGRALPQRLPHALLLSGFSSLLLAGYVLSFSTKGVSHQRRRKRFFPEESLAIIRRKEVIVLAICFFLISIADKFYFFGMGPYLKSRGFSEASVLPLMSLGQVPELFVMWTLGSLIGRFGQKKIVIIGIVLEAMRFIVFGSFLPLGGLLFGIAIHGLIYTFIFAASYVYLDSLCDPVSRAGVHQYFAMINAGAGSLLGNALAGFVFDLAGGKAVNWIHFWMVPVCITAIAFVVYSMRFRPQRSAG